MLHSSVRIREIPLNITPIIMPSFIGITTNMLVSFFQVHVNAEDLIPELPKPSTLRPFPTSQSMCYTGHETMIRSISVDTTGQWLASGMIVGHRAP